MAGKQETQKKTNHTLVTIANILNEEKINDWFIFFGTLLGIIRENNCIEGDDDIDIMINYDYNKLRNIFKKHGFKFTTKFGIRRSKKILKTVSTDEFASFDFYMCEIDNKNYFTPWQNVEVRNVEIEKMNWNETILNLPNNSVSILKKMYGENWKTPISYRGRSTPPFDIYDTRRRTII